MTQVLRQSTATDVLIGPFLDRSDGFTAETGESPAVKLSKNGQTLGAKSDSTTPVHDADGYYNCEFDATDTNTVGTLVLTVAASADALPVRHEFQVIEEAAYDALYASGAGTTGLLGVNIEAVEGSNNASQGLSAWFRGPDGTMTADSGSTTTLTDAALTQADADYWKGSVILFTSGDLVGQARLITGFDAGTDTLTFFPATTQAVSTHNYVILPAAMADVWGWLGTLAQGASGRPQVDVELIEGGDATDAIQSAAGAALTAYDPPTKAELDAAVAGLALEATAQDILADTAEIATVDGNVDAIKAKTDSLAFTTAGHVDANVRRWNGTAPLALSSQRVQVDLQAAGLGTDAAQEIAGEVWANATRTLTAIDEDDTTLDLDATIQAAVDGRFDAVDSAIAALPSSGDLSAIDGKIDTISGNVDGVKAKTDGLTFTVPGAVDANVEAVNGTAVTGSGTEVDPWGP